MEWFEVDWALAAIKQAASLSGRTGNSLDSFFCVFVGVYLYWESMVTKYEVFDGCERILYAILGVRPYTAIVERWERCGYLPAVKYPGWYLCLSCKSSVGVNDVKDCNETVWNMWRYLSCVSCVCILGLGYAFVSFWVCRVMVCLVLGVHLIVLCWSVFLCEVLGLLCVLFFWCIHVLVPGDVISGGCTVSGDDLFSAPKTSRSFSNSDLGHLQHSLDSDRLQVPETLQSTSYSKSLPAVPNTTACSLHSDPSSNTPSKDCSKTSASSKGSSDTSSDSVCKISYILL